jgi:hypothetical protein
MMEADKVCEMLSFCFELMYLIALQHFMFQG